MYSAIDNRFVALTASFPAGVHKELIPVHKTLAFSADRPPGNNQPLCEKHAGAITWLVTVFLAVKTQDKSLTPPDPANFYNA